MEIRTLKYFLAIAKEESFSAAGENVLFVTQPTLSRQMHDLEEELGVKLFRRTGKKTLLTYAGLRVKKRAEEIIDLVQRTSAEFEGDSEFSKKDFCTPDDLLKEPLIVSRQALLSNELSGWFGKAVSGSLDGRFASTRLPCLPAGRRQAVLVGVL